MAYLEEMEEKEEKMEEMPEEGGSEEMEMGEMEEESPAGSSGLKMKIRSMLEDLNPEGPEEEDLVEKIKEMVSEGGEEMEMEEEMEDEDMAPGPSMGFDIVAMRKRAAKNALPEM